MNNHAGLTKREEFLIHLYDQLWNSIMRVEQGLWQFVGIYAAILGVHLSLGEKQPTLASAMVIVASYWGINIAINAGKWFERNRMMIISIEQQFLESDGDYGKIMPKAYGEKKPRKFFTYLDRIHISVFAVTLIMSLVGYWSRMGSMGQFTSILLVFVGLLLTAIHWGSTWKELENFVKETSGRDNL